MKITKEREKILCATSIIIVFACYCVEKTIEAIMPPDRQLTLLTATFYMVILCCIIYYLAYCEAPFYGLLTSLIGYKMMPVPILYFNEVSKNGSILYYLLIKAAQMIFIIMIIKFYNAQEDKENKIHSMPILAIMLSIPFFSEIGSKLTDFFFEKTGSYLLGYFSQFACYGIATLAIICISMLYGYKSLRFMTYYELIALSINIVRICGKIVFKLYNHYHVSGSLYGWLIVYLSLFVLIYIAKVIIKKRELNAVSE